ncbi:putative phage head-tail adaptor [Acinetobacter guillouiae]|uniref:phage head closure protein n=1 Tax=Acinetobacter guillouiae TaxID=106649 RepID=UPI0004EF6509|nr:phage head closure protein [Acinetobacter guillouiae]BAP36678.1 putative phage head-tail adaptor [Acinetobacter guillouiae]
MRSNELRHRVQIQQKTDGRDENNYPIPEQWVDYKTLWAKITPLSARDLIAAQAAQSETVARLKINYRTDIETTMRVIHKGRIYAITSSALDDPNSGNEYCTFTLSGGLEKYPP